MNCKERQCPVCGKVFTGTNNAQKYCSAKCREKAQRISQSSRWETCGRTTDSRCKKKRKPAKTLAEINELAKAEGLTYGKYFAKYGY